MGSSQSIKWRAHSSYLLYGSIRRNTLLHGFIKKSQKTPPQELALAQRRKRLWLSEVDQ